MTLIGLRSVQKDYGGRAVLEGLDLKVNAGARPEILDLQRELDACGEQLGSPEVASDLRRMQRVLERQERLLRRFTELGGPGFEGEIRGYLGSLGIGDGDMDRPMRDLSGGQRKLAVLASCLERRPDVLLLDEPEAHLDAGRRELLEAIV